MTQTSRPGAGYASTNLSAVPDSKTIQPLTSLLTRWCQQVFEKPRSY